MINCSRCSKYGVKWCATHAPWPEKITAETDINVILGILDAREARRS